MKRIFLIILFTGLSGFSQTPILAVEYYESGEYFKAAQAFEAILPSMKAELGIYNEGYQLAIILTAESYLRIEEYEKSRTYYSLIFELFKSKNIVDKDLNIKKAFVGYLEALLRLAESFYFDEDYKNTQNVLDQIDDLCNYYNVRDYHKILIYNLKKDFYGKIGNRELSSHYGLETLMLSEKYYGENSSEYIIFLLNTAVSFADLEKYEKALDISELALDKYRELEKDTLNSKLIHIYVARAYAHIGLGKLMEAEKDLIFVMNSLKKEEIRSKVPKPISIYASASLMLGSIYTKFKFYEEALNHYNVALKLSKMIYDENSHYIATIELHIAETKDKLNENSIAKEYYLSALKKAMENYQNIFYSLNENEKQMYINNRMRFFLESLGTFALKHKEADPSIVGDLYDLILFQKNQLLNSTITLKKSVYESNNDSLKSNFNLWLSTKKQIASQYDSNTIEKDSVKKLEEVANRLEKSLVAKSEVFNTYNKVNNITWKDIQKNMKQGEVAIEFIDLEFYNELGVKTKYYCALILKSQSKFPDMVTLFDEKELTDILKKNINNNKKGIESIYGTKNYANNRLYELIWKPIKNHMIGRINKVYYSPSGLLNNVSFSAISDGSHYLSYSANFIRLTTTSKIDGYRKNYLGNSIKEATLFGGIDYGSNTTKWKNLNGTLNEIKEISEILKSNYVPTQVFSGIEATEEKLLSGTNCQILHIATHGYFKKKDEAAPKREFGEVIFNNNRGSSIEVFEDKNPLLRSGLVFAGANNNEDALLTAFEVANLNLNNLDLVVLSACETGLGDVIGKEGVYGLQRAFKMAGAKYLIVSLWKVPDKETKEFMVKFYKNLLRLGNIELAFNSTQRFMNKKYDPYYWASFFLIR